jgi:TRAP-type mannitol/chloroaromatic compound transport system permease large subunit
LQVFLFITYTFVLTRIKPTWLPGVPKEDRTLHGWALWRKCLAGIIPAGALIFLVLGTMLMGLATPTEAGAMGTVGALVLAVIRHPKVGKSARIFWGGLVAAGIAAIIGIYAFKSLPFQVAISVFYAAVVWMLLRSAAIPELRALIKRAFEMTMRLTAMVIFILIGSMCFSTVFQGVNGGPWLEHMMTSIPGGVWGFLIAVNVFIFFIAFFLDFFEIVFILVPLLAPIAKTLLAPIVGEDAALIWFGVMLCVNLQTSFMHPPFGFALFYLRGVAPKEVKSSDIYWGAIPFVFLQLILVALVVAFPKQVTMFLDAPLNTDLDKVRIELQQEAPEGAGKAQENQDDIMKSFGGSGEVKPAPPVEPEKAAEPEKAEAEDLMKAFGAPPAKK